MRRATREALRERQVERVVPSLDHALLGLHATLAPLALILHDGPPFTEEKWEAARAAIADTAALAVAYMDALDPPAHAS